MRRECGQIPGPPYMLFVLRIFLIFSNGSLVPSAILSGEIPSVYMNFMSETRFSSVNLSTSFCSSLHVFLSSSSVKNFLSSFSHVFVLQLFISRNQEAVEYISKCIFTPREPFCVHKRNNTISFLGKDFFIHCTFKVFFTGNDAYMVVIIT